MPSLFNQTITNHTNIYPNEFNVSFLSFIVPIGGGFILCIWIFIADYFKCCLGIYRTNRISKKIIINKIPNKRFIIKDMEYYSNANIIEDIKEKEEHTKTCSICIENVENTNHIVIMPCKHIFHKKCIKPWLVQKVILGENPQCPMCRFQFEIDFLEENQVYRNKKILCENNKN